MQLPAGADEMEASFMSERPACERSREIDDERHLSAEEQAAAWATWVRDGPDGPILEEGERERSCPRRVVQASPEPDQEVLRAVDESCPQ